MINKFIVDVPVEVQIWIRPELQKKQFEIIRQAKPSILFICSDGGRNEEEWEKIRINRKLYDECVDWECKIYRLYEECNNGMYKFGNMIHKYVWANVDRCIFLEDDQIPSASYFEFCAQLLEKYKNDERISFINGVNLQGVTEDCPFDYFFARCLLIGGVAMWKRTYKTYNDMSYRNYDYIVSLLKKMTHENKYSRNISHWKQIRTYIYNDYCFGHEPHTEFFLTFSFFARHQLAIVPKYNLISYHGVGSDAVHSTAIKNIPKSTLRLYFNKTYSLKFPLVENDFVMPNLFYEKFRMDYFALNNPIKYYFRNVVKLLLILKNSGVKATINKIKNYFRNKFTLAKIEN